MEPQRAVLLIFLILFFLFAPDTSQPSRSQRKEYNNRILRDHQALETLRNSSYGHLPLVYHDENNASSGGDRVRYDWSLLPEVQKRARAQYLKLFLGTEKVSRDDFVAGSEKVYEAASETLLPFYQNVSATIKGDFVRQLLTGRPYSPDDLTSTVPQNRHVVDEFWKNITEDEGSLTVRLFQEDKDSRADVIAREISANVAIQTDSSPGSGWEIKLFGVHNLKTGSIILTSTSKKFSGIFTLPLFALTRADYEQSKELLNRSLSETIFNRERSNADEPSFPWTSTTSDESTSIFSPPSCEYIIYLQQQPVHFKKLTISPLQRIQLLRSVEKELRFPEGASIPEVPPMVFNAVIFSPDCGFVLESGEDLASAKSRFLSGPKIEAFWTLVRHLVLGLLIVLGLQIALLKRQMDEASTPSMRSRTSYHSIGIMAMADGLMLATLIAVSTLSDTGFLILTAAGFLCFFNFAFFEMKFIYDIWLVQVGHHRREERGRTDDRANAEVPDRTTTQPLTGDRPVQLSDQAPSNPSSLPLPVTASHPAGSGATPIILPPDQDIDAAAEEDRQQNAATTGANPGIRTSVDFQTLYSRFYFSMLVLVFFSLWASTWPKSLRSAYVNLLCFAYLSFWIPQIYRNVMRNCRQAFTWEYVIGISILRLLPVIYCYTKTSNTLSIETDPFAAAVLAGWVFLQVLALAVQHFLGPRLFVKESWCPPAYDYHPLLQSEVGDSEAGSLLPIGFVASASEAKEKDDNKDKEPGSKLKVFDCAICMNEIEVPVVPSKETADRTNLGASWLGRRTYMVTPCRHIFHSECLEGWMRLRLVCPICRESLPPL
jgi:transmembrane E3 ubiquitin-protein ligase